MTIVVLGSSVTFGKGATEAQTVWGSLLEINLNVIDGIKAKLVNHGYSGYSTANLISKRKIEAVMKDKADIQWIMNKLSEQLPETLVILQTANPTLYNDVFLEEGKGTYDQYNNEIGAFVKAQQ